MDQGYLEGRTVSDDLMVDVPEIRRARKWGLTRCKTVRVLAEMLTSIVIV